MPIDKKTFLKVVTIIYDTREQKNAHIIDKLNEMGVISERRKLDYGDYSFIADDRDFSMSCVVERKADVDELYGNIMTENGERLKKELSSASSLAKELTLIIEGISSWNDLRRYQLPKYELEKSPQRVNRDIGANVYAALRSWSANSRYAFKVDFVQNKQETAAKLLEIFYYYWRNYKELTEARKK